MLEYYIFPSKLFSPHCDQSRAQQVGEFNFHWVFNGELPSAFWQNFRIACAQARVQGARNMLDSWWKIPTFASERASWIDLMDYKGSIRVTCWLLNDCRTVLKTPRHFFRLFCVIFMNIFINYSLDCLSFGINLMDDKGSIRVTCWLF